MCSGFGYYIDPINLSGITATITAAGPFAPMTMIMAVELLAWLNGRIDTLPKRYGA